MEAFPEQRQMTKDDYVIILGDFGGIWEYKGENKKEKNWLDWFEERSYTLLFLDGNHENFDRLNAYPEKSWHGGRVHEIRPSVLHLMRGQVYEIGTKKVFTFGGAASHDISAGILDPADPLYRTKRQRLNRQRVFYRVLRQSWWPEELASEEEMAEGLKNLAAHENRVDLILSHCCASSTQAVIGRGFYKPDAETDYLEQIKQSISYDYWLFGHYHDNRRVSEKEFLLYEQFVRVE